MDLVWALIQNSHEDLNASIEIYDNVLSISVELLTGYLCYIVRCQFFTGYQRVSMSCTGRALKS